MDRGVRFVAEHRRLGAGKRRLQQAKVADLGFPAKDALGDVEQVVEIQEDHWPSRSSASAKRGNS